MADNDIPIALVRKITVGLRAVLFAVRIFVRLVRERSTPLVLSASLLKLGIGQSSNVRLVNWPRQPSEVVSLRYPGAIRKSDVFSSVSRFVSLEVHMLHQKLHVGVDLPLLAMFLPLSELSLKEMVKNVLQSNFLALAAEVIGIETALRIATAVVLSKKEAARNRVHSARMSENRCFVEFYMNVLFGLVCY